MTRRSRENLNIGKSADVATQQHTVAVIKQNYAGPVSRACWSDILCQAHIWQLSCWSRAALHGKIEEKQDFTAEDLSNYLFNLLI